jgi:hypothetical protein
MMRRGATFDVTGQYRYRLWRRWDGSLPRVVFVMLNPSTADHRQDDPTIRRCIGFARDWGYGGLVVVNLFAYRTASVTALFQARDPVGPDNDRHVAATCGRAAAVVLAWGVHGTRHGRAEGVLGLLARHRARLLCLGTTRHGHPRHPLYLPGSIRPAPFVC